MRKVLHILTLVIVMMAMTDFTTVAQRHGGTHGNERHNTERRKESARPAPSSSRPVNRVNHNTQNNVGSSGRPGVGNNTTTNRPNNGGNNVTPNRPGNNGNNVKPNRPNHGGNNVTPNKPNGGNNRPTVGNNTGTSGRPGVGSEHHRPGVGVTSNPTPSHRPGATPSAPAHRPVVGNRPVIGNQPGANPATRPPMIMPPNRPYRPVIARPTHRPLPPPSWRPRTGLPVIRGILGLTFGVAFNVSLNYLYNSGYTVDGYANNTVYLRNVPAMNYIWTDGALYYGNNGLDASSFYYSTPGYDLSRYNAVYATLVNTYGQPVTVNNAIGSMSATWFGGNNGYITLSFGAGTAGRFLTTLTLGL